MGFRLASAAFIAVFAVYLFLGGMGVTDRGNPEPREAPYNLLARGLLSGHLYVARDVPPGLEALRDPYDPGANSPFRDDPRYRLHDFSYYRGRLYLYFGAAPALLVFIPWHLLTGGWMPHWAAVVLFCSAGVLVNLSLVRAVCRSVFPQAPPWADAACLLVLGFASYGPLLTARADVWEIPIAAAYLMVSVALRCLWQAMSGGARAAWWIAAASAALGVAFASRPTALVNAAVLLVPLVAAGARQRARDWAAAVVPIGLCGAAVGAYNALRFGSALDFGQHYQMASVYVERLHTFSASYVRPNLWLYLLQPVRWSAPFPFAHEPPLSQIREMLPPGHGGVEQISGLLLYAPVLWAALAVPVAVRSWGAGRRLAQIAAAAAWVALSSFCLLSFFFGTCSRYQFEFAPALALLACFGIVAIESRPSGAPRTALRLGGGPGLLVRLHGALRARPLRVGPQPLRCRAAGAARPGRGAGGVQHGESSVAGQPLLPHGLVPGHGGPGQDAGGPRFPQGDRARLPRRRDVALRAREPAAANRPAGGGAGAVPRRPEFGPG
jgi:hypothetical protein